MMHNLVYDKSKAFYDDHLRAAHSFGGILFRWNDRQTSQPYGWRATSCLVHKKDLAVWLKQVLAAAYRHYDIHNLA